MAKLNVFLVDFTALLDEIAQLKFLSDTFHTTLDRWVRRDTKILEEQKVDPQRPGRPKLSARSSTLLLRNLENGDLHTYGSTHSSDEHMLKLAEETSMRTYGYILSLSYEATELFITAFFGDRLFQLRSKTMSLPKRDTFEATGKHRKNRNTLHYFQEYARFFCKRNSDDALDFMYAYVPELRKGCTENRCQADMVDLYKGIAACRHQMIHRGGEVTQSFRGKLTAIQWGYCDGIVRPSLLTGKKTLLPNYAFVVNTLQHLASFAFLLYSTASVHCRMQIEMPPDADMK